MRSRRSAGCCVSACTSYISKLELFPNPAQVLVKCGIAWNKSAQPQLNQKRPSARGQQRLPRGCPRATQLRPQSPRYQPAGYLPSPHPTPEIVQNSSCSPVAYHLRTGLEQGLSVHPLRATVPRAGPGCTRAVGRTGLTPPPAPAGHVASEGSRDPRPDLRKDAIKKTGRDQRTPPGRGRHTACVGREGGRVRCQVRARRHRWVVRAQVGGQVQSRGRKRGLRTQCKDGKGPGGTQVGSEDTRGCPG